MPADEQVLVEQLTRLGSSDPVQAARSEIEEDIPQVAFARLERLVRKQLLDRSASMETWWANLQRERERRPQSTSAAVADVVGRCLEAGITLAELGVVADSVAHDSVAGFAHVLGDDWDDELGYPTDLPSWRLCEVRSEDDGGEHTGRTLDGLHELLG